MAGSRRSDRARLRTGWSAAKHDRGGPAISATLDLAPAAPGPDLPVAEGQVGALIRGRGDEVAVVVEAARLAGRKPWGVAFIAVRPPASSALLPAVGLDVDSVRREGEMAQRRLVRRLAEPWLEGMPYTLAMVGHPVHRSAVDAARDEGCDTLVVAADEARRGGRGFWRAVDRVGLRVIVVPAGREAI